ncbi:DUF427 domain-containing protein [Quadrisphaera sp. RL12-1S]|nr:DUF427 domain-containing protein [Quadrisphaera sp. RL12-1S]
MATAELDGTLIATTTKGRLVEGNVYFPASDVRTELLSSSPLTTLCPWKGIARYRHLTTEGRVVKNAAWTYPVPLPFAWFVRDRLAFELGSGVTITYR